MTGGRGHSVQSSFTVNGRSICIRRDSGCFLFLPPLRSQESLLKASLPGLYRSESQLYPHVVLQRVPTPTAPAAPSAPSAPLYLHLPPSSSSASSPAHVAQSQPQIMAQYPTPTYAPGTNTAAPAYPHPTPAPIYPNPHPPPQRPWQ